MKVSCFEIAYFSYTNRCRQYSSYTKRREKNIRKCVLKFQNTFFYYKTKSGKFILKSYFCKTTIKN